MIIAEVVTLAKYSELSGVSVKDNVDAIVAFMNLGMLELHSRFNIKVEEHIVELQDESTLYTMPNNFMYATDAFGEAPENAINQVIPIPINSEDSPISIFFNSWNKLQVPRSVEGGYISIVYIAKPDTISVQQAQDGSTELDLPDTLIECLLSYIGYRAHLGVKSDGQSENNAHLARFERNCIKARELGVAFPADSMSMSSRVNDRGFA